MTESTVNKSSLRALRVAVISGMGAITLLGAIAPLISASRFKDLIQQNLESSLDRKVSFDSVHFTLFSGPGFTLENVVISEDPRYGVEPFAFVPTLHARVRIDKLIFGQVRISSLHLVQPSMNLVKRSDGAWNIIDLVQRVSQPRRAPMNFFPALAVSQGRLDFKLGVRKTILYVLNSDLSIYPARSKKLYIQFSGSPARTDRAGNGFGHFRGSATWELAAGTPNADQLHSDIVLEDSNLSELATLFEGHDLGVHGTVSSHVQVEGPAGALRITGDLHLKDVHRWDLLPFTGEDWRIRYRGHIDLITHRLDLETVPWRAGESNPAALQMRVNDFLGQPAWSVLAQFSNAPLKNLLPLGRRMGLSLPDGVSANGTLRGAIGYSSSAGLAGSFVIADATATLRKAPALHAKLVNATISPDRIHFDPTPIVMASGTLEVGGDYYLSHAGAIASLKANDVSLEGLKSTAGAWFALPDSLTMFQGGDVTGQVVYSTDDRNPVSWSGQFDFVDSTLSLPVIAVPLREARGRVAFDHGNLNLERFSAVLGIQTIHATYRYTPLAKHPERLHVELAAADLDELEAALDPTLRAQGILARLGFSRLGFSRRAIPSWVAERNLDGDVTIGQFSINRTMLGPLSSHFIWQGTNLQFTNFHLSLPEGLIRASGIIDVNSYTPRYHFAAKVTGFPWRGGLLSASGAFETSGTGADTLQHLRARGSFSGADLALSTDDTFSKASGAFEFSFADGWPDLRLSGLEVSDGEDAWDGEANTQSDGKLVVDLQHEGQQRRVVSTLVPAPSTATSSLNELQAVRR